MRYVSIAEGRQARGLRLVLTAGAPGPWSEAAKAIFTVKGLDYLPVLQEGGGENAELLAWTGQSSAPVAVWEDEKPVSESLDILFLAERLAPSPRLVPEAMDERITMFGITREIIGRRGFGWERRTMMFARGFAQPEPSALIRTLAARYDYRDSEAAEAPGNVVRFMQFLAATLARQRRRGSPFLVGDGLSAADLYWACFSNMLVPLPHADCPMPDWLRDTYGGMGPVVAAALDPLLLEHRDFVFREYIGLPLDFMAE